MRYDVERTLTTRKDVDFGRKGVEGSDCLDL